MDVENSAKGVLVMPRPRSRKSPRPHSRVDVELGERIRSLRKARGITQEEFGKLIDQPQRVVSFFEQGHRRLLATELLRIANALKVSVKELSGNNGNEPTNGQRVQSRRVLRRLQLIERLPRKDQQAVFRFIDNAVTATSNGRRVA